MHGHPLHPEYSYKAFFACRPSSGVDGLGAGSETRGAAFFRRGELPPLSLARVMPEHVTLAFAHHADPARPTEFD